MALACYSDWISVTCESQKCGYGDAFGAVQSALVLSIICYTWQLLDAIAVVVRYPDSSAMVARALGWVTAAKAGVRFSVPSALAGVMALWMALHSEWSCWKMEWYMLAVGVVHLLGSMLVLTAVLFSGDGNSQTTVVRVAIVFVLT